MCFRNVGLSDLHGATTQKAVKTSNSIHLYKFHEDEYPNGCLFGCDVV
jgi:hypothetical protein